MSKKPCKICTKHVSKRKGIRCQGACKKWAHYSCLNYSQEMVQEIKAGALIVRCPCPVCPEQLSEEKCCPPTKSCKYLMTEGESVTTSIVYSAPLPNESTIFVDQIAQCYDKEGQCTSKYSYNSQDTIIGFTKPSNSSILQAFNCLDPTFDAPPKPQKPTQCDEPVSCNNECSDEELKKIEGSHKSKKHSKPKKSNKTNKQGKESSESCDETLGKSSGKPKSKKSKNIKSKIHKKDSSESCDEREKIMSAKKPKSKKSNHTECKNKQGKESSESCDESFGNSSKMSKSNKSKNTESKIHKKDSSESCDETKTNNTVKKTKSKKSKNSKTSEESLDKKINKTESCNNKKEESSETSEETLDKKNKKTKCCNNQKEESSDASAECKVEPPEAEDCVNHEPSDDEDATVQEKILDQESHTIKLPCNCELNVQSKIVKTDTVRTIRCASCCASESSESSDTKELESGCQDISGDATLNSKDKKTKDRDSTKKHKNKNDDHKYKPACLDKSIDTIVNCVSNSGSRISAKRFRRESEFEKKKRMKADLTKKCLYDQKNPKGSQTKCDTGSNPSISSQTDISCIIKKGSKLKKSACKKLRSKDIAQKCPKSKSKHEIKKGSKTNLCCAKGSGSVISKRSQTDINDKDSKSKVIKTSSDYKPYDGIRLTMSAAREGCRFKSHNSDQIISTKYSKSENDIDTIKSKRSDNSIKKSKSSKNSSHSIITKENCPKTDTSKIVVQLCKAVDEMTINLKRIIVALKIPPEDTSKKSNSHIKSKCHKK